MVTFGASSRLKVICERAFVGCSSLKSICIPAISEKICSGSFGAERSVWGKILYCESLQNVLFESGSRLNTIGEKAFAGCSALESINIPASVTVLEFGCFSGFGSNKICMVKDSLVSVTFESGSELRKIEAFAFAGRVSLVSICIPASVEILGNDCFGGLYLTENPKFCFGSYYPNRDFRCCISLESVTFEKVSKMKEIGARAFTGCISLRSICIPASVEILGDNCFGLTVCDRFYGCQSLYSVIIERGSMLRIVGSNVFKGCDSLPRIEIFPDFSRIQRSLFCDDGRKLWVREFGNGWSFLRRFDGYYLLEEGPIELDIIPAINKLMGLSDSLFCRCIIEGILIPSFVNRITGRWTGIDCDIRELEIPSSIEILEGSSVFFGFSSLEDLRFGLESKVRIIEGFRECQSLFRVFLPSSVEIISGFCKCESLSEVLFSSHSQVREIEGFGECLSLCRIEIPSTVDIISSTGFLKCKSLSDIYFEDESHLREISGFAKCTRLHIITIPRSVEFISATGFLKCKSLSEIAFENESRLRNIGGFAECTGLHVITIPTSVEVISATGFSKCTSLTKVLFTSDSNVREISGFQRCESLCQIEIPRFVEVICEKGFEACQSLRGVRFSTGSCIREISGFRDCCSLSYVEIPQSIERIDPMAFSRCALPFQMTLSRSVNLEVMKFGGPKRKMIVYQDDKVLKQHRHQIHLTSLGYCRKRRL
jgi:hypothetical protein